jgi:hypothetical protein
VRGEAEKGLQNALALTKQNLESAP